jgi:hypothetical protein
MASRAPAKLPPPASSLSAVQLAADILPCDSPIQVSFGDVA